MIPRRVLGTAIAALVVAVAVPLVVAGPASATSYRYWTYWNGDASGWTFSAVGSLSHRPPDGGVEGWRFAISPGVSTAPAPRYDAAGAFASICSGTAPATDRKRVAVVVDFGVGPDARPGDHVPSPPLHGSCVVLSSSANGWQALTAAGYTIRNDGGLVCGLSGYPSAGCGEIVADRTATPRATPTRTPSRGPAGTSGGATSNGSRTTVPAGGAGAPALQGNANSDGTDATPRPTSGAASPDGAAPRASATTSNGDAGTAMDDTPTLVAGAPTTDRTGSGRGPLLPILGLLVVVGVGGAAAARSRRSA